MKNVYQTKVMYADTDAYKVVWHGNYLRWFEKGRYEFCQAAGVDLQDLENSGICFPVVDLHVQYKAPAKIFEDILVETEVSEVKSRTIKFHQTIKNKKSGILLISADVIVAAVNTNTAKLFKMDKDLCNLFCDSMK